MNWIIVIAVAVYVIGDLWQDRLLSRRIRNLEFHLDLMYAEIDGLYGDIEE